MLWIIPFQAGKYVWQTYKEIYDLAIKVGNALRSSGVEEVSLLSLVIEIYYPAILYLKYPPKRLPCFLLLDCREQNAVFLVSTVPSGL